MSGSGRGENARERVEQTSMCSLLLYAGLPRQEGPGKHRDGGADEERCHGGTVLPAGTGQRRWHVCESSMHAHLCPRLCVSMLSTHAPAMPSTMPIPSSICLPPFPPCLSHSSRRCIPHAPPEARCINKRIHGHPWRAALKSASALTPPHCCAPAS